MTIFVDAARIIMNLGGLGSQFYGVDSPQYGGEYLAGSVSSMGADALTPAASIAFANRGKLLRKAFSGQQFSKIASRTAGKTGAQAVAAASLILWTINIVEVLELTTGFGPPDEGADLDRGSEQFAELSEQLKSALPDESWQGSGSAAYAELDASLQDIAQKLAELDTQLATLVKDQAEWVTHMRLGFGILKDLLLAAFVIEVAITLLPPPAGPIPARAFGLTVSGLGITIAAGFIGTLLYFSVENGKRAGSLATQYDELIPGTVQTGWLAQSKVSKEAESAVSSFGAISSSMSGASALAGAPTAAPLAKAASGADDERAPLSALSDGGETPAEDAPPTPYAPSAPAAAAAAPAFTMRTITMPSLAQVSAMAGQGAKLSGQLSQHTNQVNQAMGQIQRMAQMGQQGQGAAPAAEEAAPEEGALVADVQGADAGTATAERAPVEAAPGSAAQAANYSVR